jgi:hypothetical protein
LKATFVGPLPAPKLHGSYVSFTLTVGLPTTGISKDLPELPTGHTESWTLYVTRKQWERVQHAFRIDPQERAVAEGIAVVQPDKNCLWVTALKAVSIEKARQEAQKAAAQAVG